MGKTTRRALLAEMDRVNRAVMGAHLRAEGYTVRAVTGLQEALRVAQETAFDLAVCDLEIPGMDGLEFRRRLAKGASRDVPILFLTERVDRPRESFVLRDAPLLLKPVPRTHLRAALAYLRAREERRMRREGATLSGSLLDYSVADLARFMERYGLSGRASFDEGDRSGWIQFSAGQPASAQTGQVGGVDAFHRLLRWSAGSFQVDLSDSRAERSIQRPLVELLLEGLARAEQWEALRTRLPEALDGRVRRAEAEALLSDDPRAQALVAQLDATPTIQQVLSCGAFETPDALAILVQALEAGRLLPATPEPVAPPQPPADRALDAVDPLADTLPALPVARQEEAGSIFFEQSAPPGDERDARLSAEEQAVMPATSEPMARPTSDVAHTPARPAPELPPPVVGSTATWGVLPRIRLADAPAALEVPAEPDFTYEEPEPAVLGPDDLTPSALSPLDVTPVEAPRGTGSASGGPEPSLAGSAAVGVEPDAGRPDDGARDRGRASEDPAPAADDTVAWGANLEQAAPLEELDSAATPVEAALRAAQVEAALLAAQSETTRRVAQTEAGSTRPVRVTRGVLDLTAFEADEKDAAPAPSHAGETGDSWPPDRRAVEPELRANTPPPSLPRQAPASPPAPPATTPPVAPVLDGHPPPPASAPVIAARHDPVDAMTPPTEEAPSASGAVAEAAPEAPSRPRERNQAPLPWEEDQVPLPWEAPPGPPALDVPAAAEAPVAGEVEPPKPADAPPPSHEADPQAARLVATPPAAGHLELIWEPPVAELADEDEPTVTMTAPVHRPDLDLLVSQAGPQPITDPKFGAPAAGPITATPAAPTGALPVSSVAVEASPLAPKTPQVPSPPADGDGNAEDLAALRSEALSGVTGELASDVVQLQFFRPGAADTDADEWHDDGTRPPGQTHERPAPARRAMAIAGVVLGGAVLVALALWVASSMRAPTPEPEPEGATKTQQTPAPRPRPQPAKPPEVTLEHAQALYVAGHLAEAERAYRTLSDRLADDEVAHINLASVLIDRGKDKEARAVLEAWVAGHPASVEGQLSLAVLLHQEGRLDEAKAAYSRFMEAAPAGHPEIGRVRGILDSLWPEP